MIVRRLWFLTNISWNHQGYESLVKVNFTEFSVKKWWKKYSVTAYRFAENKISYLILGLSQLSQSFGQNSFVGSSAISGLHAGSGSSPAGSSSTATTSVSPNPMTSSFSQLNNSCNVMYSHSNHGHLPDHQHPHHPQSYMNQVMAANSGFFHERELQNIGENKG